MSPLKSIARRRRARRNARRPGGDRRARLRDPAARGGGARACGAQHAGRAGGGGAIRQTLTSLGGSSPRVSRCCPTRSRKSRCCGSRKCPPKAADLHEIVKWQVRKTAPFPMEQAVLSVSPGGSQRRRRERVRVTIARRDVVHQHEQACVMAGVHAGLVDLSTFSVINSIRPARRRRRATGCSCTSPTPISRWR